MRTPVLKTKHRSVGPRKGVGNGFKPDNVNPSKKKRPVLSLPAAQRLSASLQERAAAKDEDA